METGSVTTPFGRRSMTLGMLASQKAAQQIEPDQSIDKWKIYRALCEARPLLGITDRALAVLNALLSFYPKDALSEENGLIVFPSNSQLSLRAHGMAEQTIRRHLAVLVEAGLLLRKDSPNGKRYARRDSEGAINDAFGFSLAPLLARAEEIERLAADVIAERLHLQRLRERISLCRRDVGKLIETAVEEDVAGDWPSIFGHFRSLVDGVPRTPTPGQLAAVLDEMELLREEVVNHLEMQINSTIRSGNPNHIERHIQNSNPDSITELEPAFETKQEAKPLEYAERSAVPVEEDGGIRQPIRDKPKTRSAGVERGAGLKSFPLGLVLQACPEISAYGPGGAIANWRDLMSAAVLVRSMLGVSPSAYEEASAVMGPENTATILACILERGGHINSAGGYLRDLTRRAERGEFAIGPMLMSLVRANGGGARNTG
ncbi:plasmid replication protein RepC [Rhizobium sp. Root1220]|uniref:plasmid replication protein RepC n=1 Tax=Rhizobium sp. Root1220 TaxID=1736432 RepID=UPI000700731D|nr:plasmid replication protein RepC [Rhizobium sp. Root1220]KQV70472.1 replication initiation protein RepC [Rhizobium sp. Root1220]